MGSDKRALSIRSIRSAAKKGKNAQPGLDAMWASVGWLIPAQVVALMVADVGFWLSVGAALGIAVGLAFITPILAGAVWAFTEEKSTADRAAWVAGTASAGAAWVSLGGPAVGLLLAGLALLLFGIYHPRYRAQTAQEGLGTTLPADLAEEIATLPKKIAKSVRERLDRSLASVESLHALHADLPDGEALWTDAVGCLRRIVERSRAMLRLCAIPQRSPDIDRAQQEIQDQLDELAGQLSAVVDAASRFTAVGVSAASDELTERAGALHALAEATQEVEDALRS